MALAVFINLNDKEFTLNGIPYDKTFLALPRGNISIAVVGIYEARNRILSNTLITDITVDGSAYGNIASLITALKPVLYNYGGGGGGGETPYLGKKPYNLHLNGINTSSNDELDYVVEAINRGDGVSGIIPAFTCATGQEMIFQTTTIEDGIDQNDYSIIIRKYSMYTPLTSVGGSAITLLLGKNDIYNDGTRKIKVGNSNNEDLVVHYGEIGETPIEDKVNEGDENGEAWNIEGFKIFDCLRSGVLKIYLFKGIPGQYGGDDLGDDPDILEAFAVDFQDISDQPEIPYTQNFIFYEDVTAMLAEQNNQTLQNIIEVANASTDTSIIFPNGETKRQAYYRFLGTETASLEDYILINAPFAVIIKPSITPDTGAIIKLNNPLGNECNLNAANTNTAYTLANIKAGGEATILINTNTEPVISGSNVTKVFSHTFTPNVNMHLKVKCRIIGVVEYYFLKILV